MKAAALTAQRQFEITNSTVADPGPQEVLVKSEAVGICGSDVHYFQGADMGGRTAVYPHILGHETCGTVVATGQDVFRVKVGDRVAVDPGVPCMQCEWCFRGDVNLCPDVKFHGTPPIDGTLREQFLHPATWVMRIPDSLSFDDGAMLEPLSVAVHAVGLSGLRVGKTVAVIGCGSIGLCLLQVAKISGAAELLALDLYDERLELAQKYGASHTVNVGDGNARERIADLTDGRGVDVVLEAAGAPESPNFSADICAIGGKVILVGICATTNEVIFDGHRARRKGLIVKWVRRSRLSVEASIKLIERKTVEVSSMITHHFPLAETQAAFELFERQKGSSLKIIIQPNE